MPVKRAKNPDKKRCDDLCSLLVRSLMYCEKCGYECPCPTAPKAHKLGCKLSNSHIVKRTPSWTRTMLENCQCLCLKCHAYFETHPVDFTKWLYATIGKTEYERLQKIANDGIGKKFDWADERVRLEKLYQDMLEGKWHRNVDYDGGDVLAKELILV